MVGNADIVSEFESLGDNCEFGFVQRHHGLEPGGLLRWAFSTLDGLVRAIDARFERIYNFDDLAPYTPNMVIDGKYGIAFHSEMRSLRADHGLAFVAPPDELRRIYREEQEKVSYLVCKLIDALYRGERIFVYKRNAGLAARDIARLHQSVSAYGPGRLLCVVPASAGLPAGTVRHAAPRTKLAAIEALAPYDNVESALYDSWTDICRQAHDQPWS
jgi:hypothetical protein